jgi:cyclopropane-fatty-acyl-phospholipid synthase
MRVQDTGGGRGSFAKYATEKYGARVVVTTVSKEQKALGEELCRGLPVEFRLEDYRDTTGTFDAIVSIGMFEHVGYKNYRTFMKKARALLAPDGLFLLHTIGLSLSMIAGDPWIDKYIFPGGILPSIKQVGKSIEKLFVMEDWHNFGADYDKTLMAWFANFDQHWPELEEKYGKRFYRMWKFYLLSCAALFRARDLQLWQIVLSPKGVPGGYRSVR